MKCSIILPTYNEKDNIVVLIDQILDLGLGDDVHILVVDDDSQDLTWNVVENRYINNNRVQVLRRQGLERGLVASLNDAIGKVKTDYVLWMDADLQMPANKIPDFFSKMRELGPTAVIGSRFILGGKDIRHEGDVSHSFVTSIHRHLSDWLSLVVPRLLGLSVTDVTSGYIMIKRNFFDSYFLEGSHGEYFIHLVFELQRKGHKIVEIPYILSPRIKGVSKSTKGEILTMTLVGLRYVLVTLKLFFCRFRKKI